MKNKIDKTHAISTKKNSKMKEIEIIQQNYNDQH